MARFLKSARALEARTYRPGSPRLLRIREPKERLIAALPFRDRIVQHLLIAESDAALERWFAPQSYACRRGKGTHRALARATELCRRHAWVLRLDVAKFFPSIDHAILRRLVLPRTPPAWRWLVDVVLDAATGCEPVAWHFPGDDLFTPFERRHGLPIGNLTSQVWANAMLTPIDHLLASGLGLGTFVRYSDDLVVYANDRGRLEEAWRRIEARAAELRLRLHPRSTRPVPSTLRRSALASGPGSRTRATGTRARSADANSIAFASGDSANARRPRNARRAHKVRPPAACARTDAQRRLGEPGARGAHPRR